MNKQTDHLLFAIASACYSDPTFAGTKALTTPAVIGAQRVFVSVNVQGQGKAALWKDKRVRLTCHSSGN